MKIPTFSSTLIIISLSFTISNAYSQSIYFPPTTGNQWDTINPSSLGYCDEKIDSLYDFLEQKNSKAFILLKDGKIILEKYFKTFTQDSLWYWASAGKTLTAGLVGIAQQENLLNISDSTYRYLGKGWTSSLKESEITIRNQLTMTTGLDDGYSNPDCTYDTCLQYKSDPGTRWAYHNAPYTLLDSVIHAATGFTINQYLQAKVKIQTGMTGLYLKLGFNNVYFSKARSMARYGILLLANGNWNGTQVIDSNYLSEMTNSSQTLNKSYGYLTWLNGKTSYMLPQTQIVFNGPLFADAPTDVYAALGKNGQLLNVVPSQNMVWIRMGDAPASSGALISPELNNDIWKKINELPCIVGSFEQGSNRQNVTVYPNPIIDEIKISGLESGLLTGIKITDITGKIYYDHFSISNGLEHIDAKYLPKGIYLLAIEQGISIQRMKLIK